MPADLLLSTFTNAERFPGPDRRDANKDAKSHLLNLVFVCVQDIWGRFASVLFRLCETRTCVHARNALTYLTIL